MNQINAMPLYPHQMAVIDMYKKHQRGSIITICSPRQCGKSFTIITLLLMECINNRNYKAVVLTPSYQLARKQFDDLQKLILPIPNLTVSINRTNFEIKFFNDSTIKFKSVESKDKLRGDTSNVLIVDEAAFCDKQTVLECFNYVNTTNGSILLFSTPKFKSDSCLFYTFYSKALRGDSNCFYINFNDYDLSKLLTEERKQLYRESMPKLIYRCEIEGLFIDNESELWNIEPILFNGAIPDNNMIMGVDWSSGTNGDYTVLSIFNSSKQMVAMHRFNDKTPLDTISFIMNILKEGAIKKIVVENNSIGKIYLDMLRKEVSRYNLRVQIVEFNTNNTSKRQIIEQLQLEIQNQSITLLDLPELKLDFASFEVQRTNSGLITYQGAKGFTDDIVMSVSIALYGFKQGNYCIR